jgi:hypothetical protein
MTWEDLLNDNVEVRVSIAPDIRGEDLCLIVDAVDTVCETMSEAHGQPGYGSIEVMVEPFGPLDIVDGWII